MVAVIKVGKSIHRTFYYNENKVEEGVAKLLLAANYPLGTDALTENQRLNMLLRTAESNPNVRLNSVHISLNFAPQEQISDEKMRNIALDYMEKIGFAGQPFLVYKHEDAGHPHIHIATVKVRPDGTRIETQNIGKNLSEPARKDLEVKYGLVKAEDHKKELFRVKPINAQKVLYGKSETKNAIGNVLENVIGKYKYASLSELNAVLNLYNVHAERGSNSSRTYRNNGLVYRILDTSGMPVGIPVKASLFHNKPTLQYLEKQFVRNEIVRNKDKEKTKSLIDFALKTKQPQTLESFHNALKQTGVKPIFRLSPDGLLYGITYIDFKNKVVFNGSSLGKTYSAKAIQERINQNTDTQLQPIKKEILSINPSSGPASFPPSHTENIHQEHSKGPKSILEELMAHEFSAQSVPFGWKKKKKRKKKR